MLVGAGIVGGGLGGVIMSRMKLKPPGIAVFLIIGVMVFFAGIVIATFLPCSQLEMGGDWESG